MSLDSRKGDEVPLHFTRFSPAYQMPHLPPTSIEMLEAALAVADAEGLRYVHIGNVPGHERNSTFCPGCGKRIIHRVHLSVLALDVDGNHSAASVGAASWASGGQHP